MRGLNDPRPPAPYIGVRSYDVQDAVLFHGRDADVAAVANLVADKSRWRLILLHGMTGSGKSSFLKAGLMPLVRSDDVDTEVFHRGGESGPTLFINSGSDPLMRLAEVAAELVDQPGWWRRPDEARPWSAAQVHENGSSAEGLAATFETMAPLLRKPLLLIVDQAEEVFTLAKLEDIEPASERFFDFLAAFCQRPNWIQILISMRTEFFGRYDNELRQRLGSELPVAPYLLSAPTAAMLEQVMRGPCNLTFADAVGRGDYIVQLEDGIEHRLAEQLTQSFPGPGALTALQVVGVRLVQEGLERAAAEAPAALGEPLPVHLTSHMLAEIGPVEDVIEDLIDAAIGDFCETAGLAWIETRRLWRKCTRTLMQLVKPQAEGAPVTQFLPREQFVTELCKRMAMTRDEQAAVSLIMRLVRSPGAELRRPCAAGEWPGIVTRLLVWLERPEVRVLRSVRSHSPNKVGAVEYVALGHDILAVGLARANARSSRRAERSRRIGRKFLWSMALVPVVAVVITLAVTWLGAWLDWWQWLPLSKQLGYATAAALVSVYAWMGVAIFDLRRRVNRFAKTHGGSETRRNALKGVSKTALALHHLKAVERQEFPESASVQPFPGAARF